METTNKNYQVNISTSTDEVKVFLKIKKVEYSDEKPYYKISTNKQNLTLFDPIRKVHSDKSIDYDEFDKIFTEEENSYIFEEVCRDTIQQALRGTNFCFTGYGLSHTGKKTTLVGGEDSITNLNSRGLYFRLLEKLVDETANTELSVNISFIAVNKTKYLDLFSNFMGKQFEDFDEKKVIETFKEIKTSEISNQFRKLAIAVGELNEIIHFYNKIMDLFYKLEPFNEKLYSRSHFLFFINIVDNSGQIISKITFCVLAGSEKFTPVPDKKSDTKSSQKFKESIFIQSAFENVKNCILMLKSAEYKNKIQEIPFEESPLTTILKNYINSPQIKFRIIGCVEPNTGYYDSVKDTLMYLYNCKKVVTGKSSQQNNKNELKRDEVLYELENKIKTQEKKIKTLNDSINQLQKKLNDTDLNYKKNLEIIKSAFNFDGDINKLSLNDESNKESKYARSIRDSMDMVRLLRNKILDLEKKIEDLKEENKKLGLEKRIIENDKAMVTLFTKYKEDNLHEENMRKISLTHNLELDQFKSENEILKKQIDLYKKDAADKSKFVNNLPNVLRENIDDKKKIAYRNHELVNEIENKYKKTLKESQNNLNQELKFNKQSYDGIINLKNEEIENLKNEVLNLKKRLEKDNKKYEGESIKLFKNLQNFINSYKKIFDMTKIGINLNNPNCYPRFLTAKEEFEKVLESSNEHLNRTSLPLTFASIDDFKKNKNNKNNYDDNLNKKETNENFFRKYSMTGNNSNNNNKKYSTNTNNIQNHINININMQNYDKKDLTLSASDISEEFEKINPSKMFTAEDLEVYERSELFNIILEFQQKFVLFEKFTDRVKKEKRGHVQINKPLDKNAEFIKLFNENEKLRIKYQEQLKLNSINKMAMLSQERMIEKLSSQNLLNNKTTQFTNNFLKRDSIGIIKNDLNSGVNLTNTNLGNVSVRTQSFNFKFRPQTGK